MTGDEAVPPRPRPRHRRGTRPIDRVDLATLLWTLSGRVVRLAVAMLFFLVVWAPDTEAGRGHGGGGGGKSGGGRSGGGHRGSHHGGSHGHHHHGGRGAVFIGVGPWWGPGWWGGWPGWYYPPAYAPYSPYYAPPVVTEPRVYIERQPQTQPAPAAFWYYCESGAAYYPAVQSCPEPWLKVPTSNR